METEHTTVFGDARNMTTILDESIQLMVTSPPYPMIEMWDEGFGKSNPSITDALNAEEGWKAFELMHEILDEIWTECFRVLCQSSFACINIGDATRSIGGEFALYTNRARIDMKMIELGFTPLPSIIWRKQSNAPNKFMGSGMLPAGAYVTHEHEHILIYRKGGKRQFNSKEEKQVRRESAFFWEERNVWFSDLWDIKGTRQVLDDNADRERSAAYPFELPFRIIAMYSVKGDTVLDPFMGTGSTHAAAMALDRKSIGYEIDPTLEATIEETLFKAVEWGQKRQQDRIDAHAKFVQEREASGKEVKHTNEEIGMKVMTSQEILGFYGEWSDEDIEAIKKSFRELHNDGNPCWEKVDGLELYEHKYEPMFNLANRRGPSLIGPNSPVGNLSNMIRNHRKQNPSAKYEDWVDYYYREGRDVKGNKTTKDVLNKQAEELRKRVQKLFKRMDIDKKIPIECIRDYVENMVLGSTWDGIVLGEENVKHWLKKELGLEFTDLPENVDTDLLVDLCIKVNGRYIGIQVKPDNFYFHSKEQEEEYSQKHTQFKEKFGGEVFYAYYYKNSGGKTMQPHSSKGNLMKKNKTTLDEIKEEINRLDGLKLVGDGEE